MCATIQFLVLMIVSSTVSSTAFVGVNLSIRMQKEGSGFNRPHSAGGPDYNSAVKAFRDNHQMRHIKSIKIFHHARGLLRAIKRHYPDLEHLAVAIPNVELAQVSRDGDDWATLAKDVVTKVHDVFGTSTTVPNILILVGNEPWLQENMEDPDLRVSTHTFPGPQLFWRIKPALEAVINFINGHSWATANNIKASVPFQSSILQNTDPHLGRLKHVPYDFTNAAHVTVNRDIFGDIPKICRLLRTMGSPFSINIYPFLISGSVPSVAFRTGQGDPWTTSAATYRSSLEASVAKTKAALAAMPHGGFAGLKVYIGETGWVFCAGGPNCPASHMATRVNAQHYLNNAIQFVLRTGQVDGMYLFEAFDEDGKNADPKHIENHWGMLTLNGRRKNSLDLSFSTSGANPYSFKSHRLRKTQGKQQHTIVA